MGNSIRTKIFDCEHREVPRTPLQTSKNGATRVLCTEIREKGKCLKTNRTCDFVKDAVDMKLTEVAPGVFYDKGKLGADVVNEVVAANLQAVFDKAIDINPELLNTTFRNAKEAALSSFERRYIIEKLKKHNGNISYAAKDADIDTRYFRKLMKKYDISHHDFVVQNAGQ